MRGQDGSALIESITATATLALVVSGGLSLTYVTFARVWLERACYEAIVCLATPATIRECEAEVKRGSSTALPIGGVSELRLRRSSHDASVRLKFEIFGRDVIELRDRRRLPLIAQGRE